MRRRLACAESSDSGDGSVEGAAILHAPRGFYRKVTQLTLLGVYPLQVISFKAVRTALHEHAHAHVMFSDRCLLEDSKVLQLQLYNQAFSQISEEHKKQTGWDMGPIWELTALFAIVNMD